MELRGFSHLHFIRLIKGELVIKSLNVGRGLPPVKFKKLEDICQIEETDSLPTVTRPKFEFEDFPIDTTRVKDEPASVFAGEKRVTHEQETPESDSDDDFLLDTMTLNQMKERYKAKKRKCPSKDSPGKESHFISHDMEEDCELMESLSSLKSKISKKRKPKKKFRISSSAPSPQTALSVVKSEEIPIYETISQSSASSPAPVRIKTENPDTTESNWDNMMMIATEFSCYDIVSAGVSVYSEEPDPVDEHSENVLSIVPWEEPDTCSGCGFEAAISSFCNEPVICVVNEEDSSYREQCCNNSILDERISNEISSEDSKTANVCDLGSQVSTSVSNELKFCTVTEESNDAELYNFKFNADEKASQEEVTMMDSASIKDSKAANVYSLSSGVSSLLSYELQVCVVNKQSDEYREHSDPKSVHAVRDSEGELMVHMAEKIDNQMSDLSILESKKEDTVIDPHPSGKYAETLSPREEHTSDTCNDSQIFTLTLEKLCETDITINNSIRLIELINRDDMPLCENGAKDDESHFDVSIATPPVGDCSSFENSNSPPNLADSAVSGIDHSPTSKEKQSVESANTLAAKKCSSVPQSSIQEPVAADLKHPPERLLSTRKVISPTSQKRLCKAMEFAELDDEQYYKYTRKLCYQNVTENKINRPEKVSPIKKCETAARSTHFSQQAKTEKNGVCNKGILKDPHLPRTVPRFSTGCASLQNCSESAILFSQQQMRDIESITNKLSRELKSMKDIVEETLHSNVNPAAPLKYRREEVGISIQNATRVEENAKRLLSIMARDCNRFCKIMKLTDKGPATSGNVASKEKRKIVFADEAGGKLCDVKTFKHDLASPVDSNGEKTKPVD